MVHAPVRVVYAWAKAGLLRREAGLLLDALDNIIVPGAGYDGSGPTEPESGALWVFATGLVDLRLSDVTTHEWTDPTNNVKRVVATRLAAGTWDPCCVVGVKIDQSLCECAGGGDFEADYVELEGDD